MEDMIPGLVLFIAMGVLAVFGVAHLTMDFRHFKEIAAQCEKQGYIQNDTTRIICTKEKPQ